MFRNRILLRANPPFPIYSSFLLTQISLCHPFPSDLTVKIESLCWNLSRQWHLACFFDCNEVFVIYARNQSGVASKVLKEISEILTCNYVVIEEEVKSAFLIAKAIDCGLRSILLNNSWSCLDDGCAVRSTFSSIEQKKNIYSLHLTVQTDTDDSFVLLISPEVVRFNRYQIDDFLSSQTHQSFQRGEQVVIEGGLVSSCLVLPSLHKGYVTGLSLFPSSDLDLQNLEQLWSIKHGLNLPKEYYIKIHSADWGYAGSQWFPSPFVLKGPGFTPAPATVRAPMSICALECFMEIIEAWDFFDGGLLKIKGACRLDICSDLQGWTKATNNFCYQSDVNNEGLFSVNDPSGFSIKDLLNTQDFRIPKLASGQCNDKGSVDGTLVQEKPLSLKEVQTTDAWTRNIASINKEIRLKPLFTSRSHVKQYIYRDSANTMSTTIPESSITNRSKTSSKKTKHQDFANQITSNSSSSRKGDPTGNGSVKILTGKRDQIKEDTKKSVSTQKGKQQNVDLTNHITAKVIEYHQKGQLDSLTIPEIKAFLVTRKAKVGGKKKELIQRITALMV